MNRLTEKRKTYRSSDAFEYLEPLDAQEFIDTMYLELRQFEDFMEICGYDSVENMAYDFGYMKGYIESLVTENGELKDYTKDLNDKLLNLHLFLKDLRDSFHEEDETYEEIDKKLKELGGDR